MARRLSAPFGVGPSLSTLVLALTASAASLACSQARPVEPAAARVELEEEWPELAGSSGPSVVLESPRRVGDRFVHRFVGVAKEQLFLTEEVVAREGDLLVVDYRLEEGDRVEALRVRLSARSERVIRVNRLVADQELPAELADYEALLARTSFAPDRNEGALSQKDETCLVGPKEFDCEVSRYQVYVGEKPATLIVGRSDEVGRDVSGEVVAVDGTLLYKAELVELQRGEEAPRGWVNAEARAEAR